jgi:predicted kinase
VSATVVLMAGLPATGKTTTARRLHAAAGGVLIRSCDVYQALGISLPAWVARTAGFTVGVQAYDRVRDRAYEEMARRLDAGLAAGADPVVVDAVHGEPEKRQTVYEVCGRHRAAPVVVLCLCDDLAEIERRLAARRGREGEPEHEASDLAVYRDIQRRWRDPRDDALPGGRGPACLTYDTLRNRLSALRAPAEAFLAVARAALVPTPPATTTIR